MKISNFFHFSPITYTLISNLKAIFEITLNVRRSPGLKQNRLYRKYASKFRIPFLIADDVLTREEYANSTFIKEACY